MSTRVAADGEDYGQAGGACVLNRKRKPPSPPRSLRGARAARACACRRRIVAVLLHTPRRCDLRYVSRCGAAGPNPRKEGCKLHVRICGLFPKARCNGFRK
uniref:Uncharacterized protein n=1 Tax=Oryza glumipatula TaxID=40148 RepID=A0A0D9ZI16_9ORYZ